MPKRKTEPKRLPEAIRDRIAFRDYLDSDMNMLRSNFAMGHFKSKALKRVRQDVRRAGCDKRFLRWRKFAFIKIAYNKEHGEPIYGWIAYTPMKSHTLVWFVYVKHNYRGLGLARYLVEKYVTKTPIYCFDSLHSVDFARQIGAQFNPFVFEDLCFED